MTDRPTGPSDGRGGDPIPRAVERWYDFRELGAYLGNVGLKETKDGN